MTTTKTAIATATAQGITPKPFGGAGGHPSYQTNLERVGRIGLGRKGYGAGQTECCAFCGKLAIGASFRAFTLTGASFDARSEDPDAVGFYPLGSDCARRLRRIVPVYTANGERV